MKSFLQSLLALFLLLIPAIAFAQDKPNFVIIFTDDQGYGDLSCFGGDHVSTPRIDQMAAEGSRLTSFYVAAPICTPSRAALMTGCYPQRIGMGHGVLLAADPKGLNPEEITIAEVLKSAGYKTGMFGKWHLGDQPEFLPTRQGFDLFWGIPYSHDIHPFHTKREFPPLPLLNGEMVIELDPDADFLTKRITQQAVKFIEQNKDNPFFVYLPHPIPHAPLHASPAFMTDVSAPTLDALSKEDGKTIDYTAREELFRQSMAELDWSVGEILDTLKKNGLDEDTLVIFTSDNGPSLRRKKNVKHAGPLSGRKGSTLEGGMREPTVVRWPGHIAAGNDNDQIMTAMDLLPTLAKLAGAEVPTDRVIDGKDVSAVLLEHAESPHEAFFYHQHDSLQAVRSGKWKLHLIDPNTQGKGRQKKGSKPTPALFDLDADIAEKVNVIDKHPEVAQRLQKLIDAFTKELSENKRPAAFVKSPKPLTMLKQ